MALGPWPSPALAAATLVRVASSRALQHRRMGAGEQDACRAADRVLRISELGAADQSRIVCSGGITQIGHWRSRAGRPERVWSR